MLLGRLRLLTILLALIISVSVAFGQSASPTPADLSADVRLSRVLDLKETGTPINELLHTISDKQVTLTADRFCAEQKVQIRLKHRSVRVLMQSLAQLLSGFWRQTPNGYELAMNRKAVKRRDDWWRLFLSEREQAMERQRAYILAQLQGEKQTHFPKPGDGEPNISDGRSWCPFWNDGGFIMHRYKLCQFYAGLSKEARAAVIENQLHFDELTPEQQKQAVYLVPKLALVANKSLDEPILLGLQPTGKSDMPMKRWMAGKLYLVAPQLAPGAFTTP